MLKRKSHLIFLASSVFVAPVSAQQSPELKKLFTTPEERQLINSNRYKTVKIVQPSQVVESQQIEVEAMQQLVMEKVETQYRISGVSVDREGGSTAWINGQSYQSGERLEDGSKVRIRATSVVIVTPDGKSHRGVSGETLEVVYERAADSHGS